MGDDLPYGTANVIMAAVLAEGIVPGSITRPASLIFSSYAGC